MYTYITEDAESGWAGDSVTEAEDRIKLLAQSYLIKNIGGVFKVCLVNFETKVSTIYEYTADFQLSCTEY